MYGHRIRSDAGGVRPDGRVGPRSGPSLRSSADGYSLPELLLALSILAVLLAIAVPAAVTWADRYALDRTASLARAHLERARVLAVAGRRTVRVRRQPGGGLVVRDARDGVVAVTPLRAEDLHGVDSLRLRPQTLRFNPRGQAGPGSLYLYRKGRGVRLVVNFVGRIRREDFTYGPP